MEDILFWFCQIFTAVTTLYGICFAVISLFLFRRHNPLPEAGKQLRFAVLIPARNEEACIPGLIESIRQQNYPQELVDIYVIPNNCIDRTEEKALQAGAQILYVSSSVKNKGQALHEAFYQLLHNGAHDAYCVFDADNEADPQFLAEMNRALAHARAAKSRIFAKNPHESWVCACYDVFFCNANLLLNRARRNLGGTAHLIGTGFAVRRDLMEELNGWNTATLTEDAEFYARLCARGEQIAFVPTAITYDEEPLSFRQSLTQRRRWMSGIIEVTQTEAPQLLHSILTGVGRWYAADCLLQLSFVWLQAWILPMFLLRLCVDPTTLTNLPAAAAMFWCSTMLLGSISLLMEHRMTWKKAAALLLYPLFLFSFLPLQTLALFLPNRQWKPITHTGVRLNH